ncbi:MAG: divergent polysaccharide deacetylase family protein [Alphaproteobacteria bacterium]|nr:divergent polysaccharide deacetylase family protein [Alphaproteobacteria bacterium]
MTLSLSQIKESFPQKAFFRGLAVVGALYLLIFVWLFLQGDNTRRTIEASLPSQTAVIKGGRPQLALAPYGQDHPGTEAHESPSPAIGAHRDSSHSDQTARTDHDLPAGDLAGLYEKTPEGLLPVIRAKDHMSVFEAFRTPFNPAMANGKPVISILIADLGLSAVATESALRTMPPEIGFILSPYADDLSLWASESRRRGHEIWLTLPMETTDYPRDDPGPFAALIGLPEQENIQRAARAMSRVQGYIGLASPADASFMNEPDDVRPLLGNVFRRGLGFLDTSRAPAAQVAHIAEGMHAPYATIDVPLDAQADKDSIRAALAVLEQTARDKGQATGLIRPLPVSYHEILAWIQTLPAKGFVLAPLSTQAAGGLAHP